MRFIVLEPGMEPYRKHTDDAGYDLKSRINVNVFPGKTEKIPAGVIAEIPRNYAGLIRARSSSTLKGLDIHGTIDSGYRGEVYLLTNNLTDSPIEIKAGERIAQLVVVPCLVEPIETVDELPESQRGTEGFGSTGQ